MLPKLVSARRQAKYESLLPRQHGIGPRGRSSGPTVSWHMSKMVMRAVLLLLAVIFVLPLPLPGMSTLRHGLSLIVWGPPGGVKGGSGGLSGRTRGGRDVLKYVYPLIGTANGGHVFPGASMPYGMAKPVADTLSRAENAAGYVEDSALVKGFSQLHDSGTGGSPSLGNFPLFVHVGCPEDDYKQCDFSVEERQVARMPFSARAAPGYFSLALNNSVKAEMTATDHTALYRFTFPDGNHSENNNNERVPYKPLILLDIQDLSDSRSGGGVQIDEASGRITAYGIYRPSFGTGTYKAYVCADFVGATIRSAGTYAGNKPTEGIKQMTNESPSRGMPKSAGAWVHFDRPDQHANGIVARVGLSFISTVQACENAEKEIPGFDFNGTRRAAEDVWADKLSAVEVDETGIDPALLVTFWSGLYRTMLSPQNYTGENQLWQSAEPYYDSFYCIWDSFRAQHPLLSILDPVAQTEMVRAIVDIYRHEGKLPDCRMSFCKGFTQGGSNADVVIADAHIKGITKGINWTTAYEAVVSDAEVESQGAAYVGRGNLEGYKELGYIARDTPSSLFRTISRTVEFAYDDFSIAMLAERLGHADDAKKYLGRSSNWQNLWNPGQADLVLPGKNPLQPGQGTAFQLQHYDKYVQSNFKGFLQPRLSNGSFVMHDTRACSPNHERHDCYLGTLRDAYEGSPWLYSFYAPQDMATLISLMGGKQLFVKRLTYFHQSDIMYMGNEQAFLTVFQFHYAGRPGLSSYWAHQYIPSQFNTTVNGIPGNDDCAMGAFSAFAMMGFFPVAGQDVYLLTPPFFQEVRIKATARKGRWAVIRVVDGFKGTHEGVGYIQSAMLDGRPWTKSWIGHRFFAEGGLLELVVGKDEGSWGSRDEDLPPSWSIVA